MALGRGRSGRVVRNLIGPEQQCKSPEDIAHFVRSQNADAVEEPRAIDGVVEMALRMSRSCCTTRAGRRPAGAEPSTGPKWSQ